MIELLVSLAIFSGLAVTTADIARRALLEARDSGARPSLKTYRRIIRSAGSRPISPGASRLREREFPGRDRWIVYGAAGEGEGGVLMPVFRPGTENASDTE